MLSYYCYLRILLNLYQSQSKIYPKNQIEGLLDYQHITQTHSYIFTYG